MGEISPQRKQKQSNRMELKPKKREANSRRQRNESFWPHRENNGKLKFIEK